LPCGSPFIFAAEDYSITADSHNTLVLLTTSIMSTSVASRLFSAVLEFWSLLLQQEPLPLAACNDVASSTESTQEDVSIDIDSSQVIVIDEISQSIKSQSNSPNSSKMARFLLNEERERLCLWKFNFTDEDLDRLTTDRSNVFGGAVVQCLVGVGEALIKNSVQILESSQNCLSSVIAEGKLLIRNAYYEDEVAETLASTNYEASVMTDFTVPDDLSVEETP
ncbi:hypothetical protein CT0861_11552, partial [Colletotrichum tofieldiae]